MDKYHKNEVVPIEKENERDETYQGENEAIDSTRTRNNYHIVKRDESYTEYIKMRLAQENKRPRKDAVLMCSFVISSDGTFFDQLSETQQEDFFTDATMYFAQTYGTENIISAVVHKDETTPHLHLNLIPFTNGRLCAKNLFCPKALRELQDNLPKALEAKWHLKRGESGSQAVHLSTAEFKAKKIVEQAESQAGKITADARAENEDLKEVNADMTKRLDKTLQEINDATTERDRLIAERDKEANYSQALKDAKDGKIARGKKELKEQVIALTIENKRLENENSILAKDNGDLFKEYQKEKANGQKAEIAKKAMFAVREHEPEAYARIFFKATGILQPFIELFSAPIPLPRNRLREIEQEVEQDRQEQQSQAKEDRSKYYWSK